MDGQVRQGSGKRITMRNSAQNRQAILDAATFEFSTKGFGGARVDAIARRAGTNKRMLYHYFGNKEELYLAVLEETYRGIRIAEADLKLSHLPPEEGIRRLVLFTWNYFIEHPEFLSLLNTENLMRAQFLKHSEGIRDLHSPLVRLLDDLLGRGEAEGLFRKGVEPVQLYITIAALGFFYMSNRWTLSTIFGRDLGSERELKERGDHVVSVVLGYLRRDG
jgi:AcrR family transcriptional regulator